MESYFAFYDIEEGFFIDLSELKRKFYSKSRELHPDFYAQDNSDKQEEALTLSAYNNEASETLKHDNGRMEYILRMHGILRDEGNNKLDQIFLMEMMDINEALMELQMDFDPTDYSKVVNEIKTIESDIYGDAVVAMKGYDEDKDIARLQSVSQYYLKKKYLLRIKDNLDKFVDA